MKLFTINQLGLNITSTVTGRRDPSQSNFLLGVIAYNAQRRIQDQLWCPDLAHWMDEDQVVAAYLFAYMHGQTTMDAMFGLQGIFHEVLRDK